jgi:hypothetical protein
VPAVLNIDYSVGHDELVAPSVEFRRAQAKRDVEAGRVSPRTLADVRAIEAEGGEWMPGARERFILEAETARADPVFGLLESRASDAGVPRLVSVAWDRMDFHELSSAALAKLLRRVFDAGRGCGRDESDARWRDVVESFLATGYEHPAPLAADLAAGLARKVESDRRSVSGV